MTYTVLIFSFELCMCCVLLLLVATVCASQTVIYSVSFAVDLHGPQHYYCLSHSVGTQ